MSSYDVQQFLETMSEASSAGSNMFSLAINVLTIVAMWFLFSKAGEPGWGAIVPFYKDYLLFKISGKKNLFWGYLICYLIEVVAMFAMIFSMVAIFATMYGSGGNAALVVFIVSIIAVIGLSIALLVFRIMQCIGLVKEFHISMGYAVGLILVPVVFYCILAFNKNIN